MLMLSEDRSRVSELRMIEYAESCPCGTAVKAAIDALSPASAGPLRCHNSYHNRAVAQKDNDYLLVSINRMSKSHGPRVMANCLPSCDQAKR